ncbi:hypothetical protein SBRY_30713 [Actinacidiphila bryophytorum]|uniref:Uncharacterized protein n=1 Tax=Actinacidiphila bryophytorum TaxID=1436133 RepID=A0A9W4H1H0_9ACTN|nr:hypothetical protein SBRY_30713 [Actinacidiphila bryophytorum]
MPPAAALLLVPPPRHPFPQRSPYPRPPPAPSPPRPGAPLGVRPPALPGNRVTRGCLPLAVTWLLSPDGGWARSSLRDKPTTVRWSGGGLCAADGAARPCFGSPACPATPGTHARCVVGVVRVGPLRGRPSALRSHAPDAAGPALWADGATSKTRP